MSPCFSIAFSTSLRRASAARGLRSGLYWDGACGRPAIIAASGRVRSLRAAWSSKSSAAASTPIAVAPSLVPYGAVFRYSVRIQSLECAVLLVVRQVRLDDLALERVLRLLDVEVPDELLGDRRAALSRLAAGGQVVPAGPDDRREIDAAVVVEPPVLDRDRRVLQVLRDLVAGDRLADRVGVDHPDQGAVGRVHLGNRPLRDRLQRGERGCRVVDVEHPDAAARRATTMIDMGRPRPSRSFFLPEARRRRRRLRARCDITRQTE